MVDGSVYRFIERIVLCVKEVATKVKNSCITQGLHHLGLTVDHVEEAASFLEVELGFNRVGGAPDYPPVFLSDGVVMPALW